jgi:sortase (surface protein transpeptidase)
VQRYRPRHQRRRIGVALVLAGLALVVAGGVVTLTWRNESVLSPADQSARAQSAPDGQGHETFGSGQSVKHDPSGQTSSPRLPADMPTPELISIPAIGVRAPVISLGLNSDGTLEVPSIASETGWFRDGPEPGEPGASVLVGHVSSGAGPAVFYHLRALRRGDEIKISLEDGSTVRFTVRSSFSAPKNRFPTDRVYRHGGPPTLHLITCDGAFDYTTRHFVDNYIVVADLTKVDMVA